MDAQVSQEALNWVILEIAVAAMHLQAVVDYVEALVSRKFLCHSTIHCVVRVFRHNQISSMSHHQPRGFQVNGHLGKLKLYILVGRYWCPKLLPPLYVILRDIEAFGSSSN